MLKIIYGDTEGVIYNTAVYFKNQYNKEWIINPRGMAMIKDVDSSVVLGSGAIESPVMGIISPERLSGGVKTLLLINQVPDSGVNFSYNAAC